MNRSIFHSAGSDDVRPQQLLRGQQSCSAHALWPAIRMRAGRVAAAMTVLLAMGTTAHASAGFPSPAAVVSSLAAHSLSRELRAATPAPSAALPAAGNGATACTVAVSNPGPRPTPVYQSWYFYLALLFIGITLPARWFRRRMMLMKGRIGIVLEERSRIASECHDTLMAGFAAIAWQLEATSRLFRDNGLDSTPAAESCELARSMVAHCQAEARRIIWDLRETDEITSVLSQALAHSLSANHVRGAVETKLEVEGEEIPLAPGCVHHLVCIGQEAVSNAIRHASPSHILVQVKYETSALLLLVRDDGRGFQPNRTASRHGHFGIAVMEERARKLGGSFRIQEMGGSGTEVSVRIPFNTMMQPATHKQHVVRWIGI